MSTKRLQYQVCLGKFKRKKNIISIESKLSEYNSKTCDYVKFKEYVKKKNEVNNELFEHYNNEIFRKLKWFSYINRQRSEDLLLNKIEEYYEEKDENGFVKDIVIIIGDWSGNNKMRFMSTPNIALKRKLAEKFLVLNIDEFRTSCLNNKTGKICENIYLKDKKGKLRKVHQILTYKMENGRQGCINRDKNSVLNMKKIVQSIFKTGERPYYYRRGVKLPKKRCQPRHKVQKAL